VLTRHSSLCIITHNFTRKCVEEKSSIRVFHREQPVGERHEKNNAKYISEQQSERQRVGEAGDPDIGQSIVGYLLSYEA